jgi:hypothetical protein
MQQPSPPRESPFRGVVVQDDVLEVMVQTSTGTIQFIPAIVWGVTDDGFQVYYLTRCHPNHVQSDARDMDQLLHVFENQYNTISWQSVNLHIPLAQFDGGPIRRRKKAFKKLGYRDLGNGRLYKISEEALLETVPSLRARTVEVGELHTDSENDTAMDTDEEGEEEQLDSHGNLADLIAPEDQVELFTEASGTPLSDDINTAQQAYAQWQPANESEQRAKDLIDSMEVRICREESNRAWARGAAL